MHFEIQSDSAEKTFQTGKKIGLLLKSGDAVLMNGDLGAGKTCMTKGIAEALKISESITSPTYTLVNEYKSGSLKLYHYDCYRLSSGDEMYEIGFEDALSDGIVILEWADNISDIFCDFAFPDNTFRINILRQDDVGLNTRQISIDIPDGRCDKFC